MWPDWLPGGPWRLLGVAALWFLRATGRRASVAAVDLPWAARGKGKPTLRR